MVQIQGEQNDTLAGWKIITLLPPISAVIQVDRNWWVFGQPERVIAAAIPTDILPALHNLEQAVTEQGLYAVGFMAYEAAAAFNLAVHPSAPNSLPLLWFGLYHAPRIIPLTSVTPSLEAFHTSGWQPAIPRPAYLEAITQIKAAIACGDTYQVNFTFPLHTQFEGSPRPFFDQIIQAQQADYTAYLDLGRYTICSASPEMFFRLEGEQLWSKPMKGTMARGRDAYTDQQNRQALYQSEKNRAENVMIVDMIRNDMGRICRTGSVKVPDLFTVEPYPTLWQMTSTVTGCTQASFVEIMTAMFPCASITGAPKVRTMELIKKLELFARGLYTGTIGYLAPGRQAQFNVAIRTAVIDKEQGRAVYGVGSGVVWDSAAAMEWDECLLKAQVLTPTPIS